MTPRFEIGDRIQRTGTELVEVAFEVLDVEVDVYHLTPVDARGTRLQAEVSWWPQWFTEDTLEEYEKI